MLKKFLIGTIAALGLLVLVNVASAYTFTNSVVKQGMTGPDVVTVQTIVGATADGTFGPMTKAAVMAWQANHGLVADGVVGPNTMAAMNSMGGTTGGTTVAGCPAGAMYNYMTGAPCATVAEVPGCPAGAVYNYMTGAMCGTTTGGTPAGLTGGVGDIEVSHYGTGEKTSVVEGDEDVNVLGFKVKADGSDVAVTSVKVGLINTADGSYKLTRYVDSVDVYAGSTKVGSADMSDFSKNSDDAYTKSIVLSNAIVRDGDKDPFYIKLNMIDNIDSDNLDAILDVWVDSVRFQDAQGVVTTDTLTSSLSFDVYNDVNVDDAASNDTVSLKSSSNNPDDHPVAVDDTNTTDDELALAFKIDVGDDSSDVTLNQIPFVVTFDEGDYDAADAVIDSMMVKIDGQEYEASLDDEDYPGLGYYILDLTDDNVVLSGGDNVEVKVYLSFAGQEDNYDSGTTVQVTVPVDDIEAESEYDDTLAFDGSDKSGAVLTLQYDSVSVDFTSAQWSTSFTSDTDPDIYTATFKFDVTAPDSSDIYLPLDTFTFGTLGTAGVEFTDSGSGTVTSAVLSSTEATERDYSYLVEAGDTVSFTFTVDIVGDNESHKVSIDSIWYETTEPVSLSYPDGTPEVTTGLTDFKTSTKTLYE